MRSTRAITSSAGTVGADKASPEIVSADTCRASASVARREPADDRCCAGTVASPFRGEDRCWAAAAPLNWLLGFHLARGTCIAGRSGIRNLRAMIAGVDAIPFPSTLAEFLRNRATNATRPGKKRSSRRDGERAEKIVASVKTLLVAEGRCGENQRGAIDGDSAWPVDGGDASSSPPPLSFGGDPSAARTALNACHSTGFCLMARFRRRNVRAANTIGHPRRFAAPTWSNRFTLVSDHSNL